MTFRLQFIRMTWAEVGLGALVLAAVSVFATGNLLTEPAERMKKSVLVLLLLACSGAALAAPQVITVSRFGKSVKTSGRLIVKK